MELNVLFFLNSILLGIGLAMDAFSVSVANAMHEPKMKLERMSLIAGCYAFFQFAMPMIGWICVHTIVQIFSAFQKFIPWIALILLLYIGGKMLFEFFTKKDDDTSGDVKKLSFGILIVQGIATSIDALSVGFTISHYNMTLAFVASVIIAIVTFAICIAGLKIGKSAGSRITEKADLLGGIILVSIGIEIFVRDLFF